MSIEVASNTNQNSLNVGFVCGPVFQFLDAPVTNLVGHVNAICEHQGRPQTDAKYSFKQQGFEAYLSLKLKQKAGEVSGYNTTRGKDQQKKGRCNFEDLHNSIQGDVLENESCILAKKAPFTLDGNTFASTIPYTRVSTGQPIVVPADATTDHIRDRYARLGADYVRQLIACTDIALHKLHTYSSDGNKKFNLFKFDIFLVINHTSGHGEILHRLFKDYPQSCIVAKASGMDVDHMFLKLTYLAFCKKVPGAMNDPPKCSIGIKFIPELHNMQNEVIKPVLKPVGGDLFGAEDQDSTEDCVNMAGLPWTFQYTDAGAYDHEFKLQLRTFADYHPALSPDQIENVWYDQYFAILYSFVIKDIGERLFTELSPHLDTTVRASNGLVAHPPTLDYLRQQQAALNDEKRCFLFKDVKAPYHNILPLPQWLRDGFRTKTKEDTEYARALYFLLLESGKIKLTDDFERRVRYKNTDEEEGKTTPYTVSAVSSAIVFHLFVSYVLYQHAMNKGPAPQKKGSSEQIPLHLLKWPVNQLKQVPSCWVVLHELIVTMNVPRNVTNSSVGLQQTLEVYDLLVMAVVGGYINQQAAAYPSAAMSQMSNNFKLFRFSLLRAGLLEGEKDKLKVGQISRDVVNRYYDSIRSNMIGMLPSAGFSMVHGGYHMIDSALEQDPGITESSIGSMFGKELPYIATLALEDPEARDSLFTHRKTLQNSHANYLRTFSGPFGDADSEVRFMGKSVARFETDDDNPSIFSARPQTQTQAAPASVAAKPAAAPVAATAPATAAAPAAPAAPAAAAASAGKITGNAGISHSGGPDVDGEISI